MPNKSLLLSPFTALIVEETFPQMVHRRGCAGVSAGTLNELSGLNMEKRKKDNYKDNKWLASP